MPHERLEHALAAWRDWSCRLDGPPTPVRRLGGKSNENHLVRAGDAQFVVRLNRESGSLGVNRQTERRILADIAGAPFAPEVVFAGDDHLVTAFVPGGSPPASDLDAIGALFGRIHDTGTTIHSVLNPVDHARHYMSLIPSPVDERLGHCFDALARQSFPPVEKPCLCHNDLLCENIVAGEDNLVAIDWEYASLGDPAFDIAVFAENYRLDPARVAALLAAYGEPPAGFADRVDGYRHLYALIEILWWLIRGGHEGIDKMVETLVSRLDDSI